MVDAKTETLLLCCSLSLCISHSKWWYSLVFQLFFFFLVLFFCFLITLRLLNTKLNINGEEIYERNASSTIIELISLNKLFFQMTMGNEWRKIVVKWCVMLVSACYTYFSCSLSHFLTFISSTIFLQKYARDAFFFLLVHFVFCLYAVKTFNFFLESPRKLVFQVFFFFLFEFKTITSSSVWFVFIVFSSSHSHVQCLR